MGRGQRFRERNQLKIHEHQAKQLMAGRGIPVPLGRVARTVDEAAAAVRPLISWNPG